MSFLAKGKVVERLCLGTVQFGLDYGIANASGMLPPEEVARILEYAHAEGIRRLDTAAGYGRSEEVLGDFLSQSSLEFEVISKVPRFYEDMSPEKIRMAYMESMDRLRISQLDGYLVHDMDNFFREEKAWSVLQELKDEGAVKAIGISLYETEQLEWLLDRGYPFDMVQFPYSIFDRRFEPYFEQLKSNDTEISVRSLFLQGLAFMNPELMPESLQGASQTLRDLNRLSDELVASIQSICVNFVLENPLVDKAVIGVDSLEHLKENVLGLSSFERVFRKREELQQLAITDHNILLPYRWKLK